MQLETAKIWKIFLIIKLQNFKQHTISLSLSLSLSLPLSLIYIYICVCVCVCVCVCNGHSRRKRACWSDLKSWKRLFGFQIVLIPFGKDPNPNILSPGMGKQLGRLISLISVWQQRKKTKNSNLLNPRILKIQTDHRISARRPDLKLINKEKREFAS